MKKRGTRVSAFDLDKTILHGAAVTKFKGTFWNARLPKTDDRVMTPKFIALAAYTGILEAAIGHRPATIRAATQMIQELIAEKPAEFFDALIHRDFDRVVAPFIYPQAREAIARRLDGGQHVVITTAAPDLVANVLAKKLEVEHVIASGAIVDHAGNFTRQTRVTMGRHKVKAFKDHLQNHGFDPADVEVFTDSSSDLPLIDFVHKSGGQVHVVNPDSTLRKDPRFAGWTLHQWNLPHSATERGLTRTLQHLRRRVTGHLLSETHAENGGIEPIGRAIESLA